MRLTLLLLIGLFFAPAALALGDRTEIECGNLTEGDIVNSEVRIICGMSPREFAENMALALSTDDDDHSELFRRLQAMLPEGQAAQAASIREFFRILGEAEVPPEQLQNRLAEIAQRHQALLDELRTFRIRDPEVQALRDDAADLLGQSPPDHDAARAKLDAARALMREKREAMARVLDDQKREEAAVIRELAELEAARLRRLEAGRLFEEAAGLLPDADAQQKLEDMLYAGDQLYLLGRDKGDNAALENAIRILSTALKLVNRKSRAYEWANTQYKLGNVLATLGEREGGTARLEAAVRSYEAALEALDKSEDPFEWAVVQTVLGSSLTTLGARERGTTRLEAAVKAHEAALEKLEKSDVPLEWALAQNNLGNALKALGERDSGTERLEAAVAAYEAAQEEWRRKRVPLDWATTQNNLGTALTTLGERESGMARLEAAVEAFEAALEEFEKSEVPLDWAVTQYNLGNVEIAIFEKTGEAAQLDAAEGHVQAAREVFAVAGSSHYVVTADQALDWIAALRIGEEQ